MALYSVTLSVGFMLAFPAVGALVQQRGWRTAWLAIGVALIAGLAPLAWSVVRRGPDVMSLRPDGESAPAVVRSADHASGEEFTWAAALAEPAFWIFALGTALYGLVASGIGLFNESILAERGFDSGVYYQTLVVTALTALAGNFAGGWLARSVSLARLMGVSLLVLAGGLIALPHVSTLAHVMTWAAAMGLGGGLVMVLFFTRLAARVRTRPSRADSGRRPGAHGRRLGTGPAAARLVRRLDRQLRDDVPRAGGAHQPGRPVGLPRADAVDGPAEAGCLG